jgi:hypothetical protein
MVGTGHEDHAHLRLCPDPGCLHLVGSDDLCGCSGLHRFVGVGSPDHGPHGGPDCGSDRSPHGDGCGNCGSYRSSDGSPHGGSRRPQEVGPLTGCARR